MGLRAIGIWTHDEIDTSKIPQSIRKVVIRYYKLSATGVTITHMLEVLKILVDKNRKEVIGE